MASYHMKQSMTHSEYMELGLWPMTQRQSNRDAVMPAVYKRYRSSNGRDEIIIRLSRVMGHEALKHGRWKDSCAPHDEKDIIRYD